MAKLKGKVVIVTGASKGIGAGIAKELAGAGAAVVVNYSSDRLGADRVVTDIKLKDGRAIAVHADMTKAADVKRLFAEAKSEFGTLDILVNNAGFFSFGPVEDVTEESFHKHYNINVLGPLLAAQEALKYFGRSGGNIINISSIVGSAPVAGGVLYSSTKGALDNLTRGLALELGPKNIRVNGIAPGFTETEGAKSLGFFEGDVAKQVIATTPLGRFGYPVDIARVVLFLASEESAWITGETIRVAGGKI